MTTDQIPEFVETYDLIFARAALIRDRLWCRAACKTLNTVEIERLMCGFNELCKEKSVCEAETDDG